MMHRCQKPKSDWTKTLQGIFESTSLTFMKPFGVSERLCEAAAASDEFALNQRGIASKTLT